MSRILLAAQTQDNTITITQQDLNLGGAPRDVTGNNVTDALGTVYLWAGIIAVLIIIIGGIRYATANGEPARVKAGKDTILYAVVGLVVIIMATAITQFIGQNIK